MNALGRLQQRSYRHSIATTYTELASSRRANGMARWQPVTGPELPFQSPDVNLRKREAQPGHLKKEWPQLTR
jgi:hypothetical protein